MIGEQILQDVGLLCMGRQRGALWRATPLHLPARPRYRWWNQLVWANFRDRVPDTVNLPAQDTGCLFCVRVRRHKERLFSGGTDSNCRISSSGMSSGATSMGPFASARRAAKAAPFRFQRLFALAEPHAASEQPAQGLLVAAWGPRLPLLPCTLATSSLAFVLRTSLPLWERVQN
jgi:hypothetical protein